MTSQLFSVTLHISSGSRVSREKLSPPSQPMIGSSAEQYILRAKQRTCTGKATLCGQTNFMLSLNDILPITAPCSHSNFVVSSLPTFYFNILWLSKHRWLQVSVQMQTLWFLLLQILQIHLNRRGKKSTLSSFWKVLLYCLNLIVYLIHSLLSYVFQKKLISLLQMVN